jgi:hypothetical protein
MLLQIPYLKIAHAGIQAAAVPQRNAQGMMLAQGSALGITKKVEPRISRIFTDEDQSYPCPSVKSVVKILQYRKPFHFSPVQERREIRDISAACAR